MAELKNVQQVKKQATSATQDEQRFKELLESLPETVVEFDMDGNITFANKVAFDTFGYTQEDLNHGLNVLQMISPEERERATQNVQRVISGKELGIQEYKAQRKDGGTFPIIVHTSRVVDYEGKSAGARAIVVNMTERKQTEEALQESETRFRELFQNMSSGVAVYEAINDGEDFVFKDFNAAGERISQIRKQDFIGKSVLEAMPGLKDFGLLDTLQSVWRTGKPEHLPIKLYKDDRLSGWRENYVYKLPSGEVVAVYDDITDRKLAEEALRESEEKLRITFESIKDLVTITDLTGTIIDVNSTVVRIGGFDSKEELIGQNGFDYVAERDRAKAIEDMERAFEKGRLAILEYTLLRKDGTEYDVEAHVSILKDNSGNPTGVISIARDISERKHIESALRESEEKLRIMFASIEDGIVVTDLNGSIVDVNDATLRLHGYDSKDEMLGLKALDLIKEESQASAIDTMIQALEEEHGATLEYKIVKRDGSEADGEGRATVLRDISGDAAGIVVITREITERKRMEKALRESEEQYRSVVENANEAIVVVQDGGLKFFNPIAIEIIGYPTDELAFKSFLELIHPDDKQIVAERELKRLTGEELPHIYPFRIIDKGGNVKWVEINAVLISWDGRPATLNFLSDITERKQAEEALRESEGKLRLIFESIGDLLMVMDLTGKIVDVNEPIIRTVGYTKEELIGRPAADLVVEKDRDRVIESTINLFETGLRDRKSEYQELSLVTKAGGTLEADYCVTPMRDPLGRMVGVLGIGHDITERKKAEEALQRRNRELTAINTISHSLSQHTRLNKVLQTALSTTLEVMELPSGGIWWIDEDSQKLRLAVHQGLSAKFVHASAKAPLGLSVTGEAISKGKVRISYDFSKDERVPTKHKEIAHLDKLQFMVSIPLKSKGRTLGVMNIFDRLPRELPPEDIPLLETIGGEIGVAIENAQLLEKLSYMSETDELTRLYNRRRFYDLIEAETGRTQRYKRPFSVVILDLDGFKRFNDRFGHVSGDVVLQNFATALKAALRKNDTAFRYGGDEFTLILPSTNAKAAKKIIDRVRAKWLKTPQSHYPVLQTPIRFSAGIAQYPTDSGTSDGLVFLADAALYIAKKAGGYASTLASELGELPEDILGPETLDQVYALASTVDARSPYTSGHSKRVAIIASNMGEAIGLPEEDMEHLRVASLLHDIGKLGIPDAILRKPEALTKSERQVIEKHCAEGAKILSHVKELAAVAPYVLYHHEWYNGEGYPEGLRGDEIPLIARIICVADSYDTMITPLPHRQAMTHEDALEELKRYSGIQFDPELVEAFCHNVSGTLKQK